MKTWNTPVVEEINFTETQYGADHRTQPDGKYKDANNEPVYTWQS